MPAQLTPPLLFGYITALSGAFSAYWYIALQNDVRGEGPLRSVSPVKQWYVHTFFCGVLLNDRSMVRARTFS